MILCCDPGFSNYGCAVINEKGVPIRLGTLQTKPTKVKITRVSDDRAYRITQISTALAEIIKTNKIKGVLGEMPSSGAKSATAMRDMAVATAISVTVFTLFNLPVAWCTPADVKKAVVGKTTATKTEMMERICKLYRWEIQTKQIFTKEGKLKRTDNIYMPLGKETPASKFEHVADALGAYEALKHSNIARMFITS